MPPKSPNKPKYHKGGKPKIRQTGKSAGDAVSHQTITGMFQRQKERVVSLTGLESSSQETTGDIEFIAIVQGKETEAAAASRSRYFESSNNLRKSKLSLKRKRSVASPDSNKKRSDGRTDADQPDISKSLALDVATQKFFTPSFKASVTKGICDDKVVTSSCNIASPPTAHSASGKDSDIVVALAHSSNTEMMSCGAGVPELDKASQQMHSRDYIMDREFGDSSMRSSVGGAECCTEAVVYHSGLSLTPSRSSSDPLAFSTTDSRSAVDAGAQDEADPEMHNGEEQNYRIPYYLENFLLIVDTIIRDDFFEDLFNDEDREMVKAFQELSEEGQKLYVRLFGRQHRWLRHGKIIYPKIAEDLTEVLAELVEKGLLLNETHLDSLDVTLHALAAPELKQLAKMTRLPTAVSQRGSIIEALLKHSRQKHISAFLVGGPATAVMGLLKKAKALLGPCFYVESQHRNVFVRIVMLFGLSRARGDDDDAGTVQQQIFQMLMSSIGRVKYPEYTVIRHSKVFRCREDLLRYSKALQTETDMSEALAQKEFDLAKQIMNDSKPIVEQLLGDKETLEHDANLVEHLRCFTAGSVYIRIWSQAVELLQFTRQYQAAAEQLHVLLEQKIYHPDYRGRWYDRLALNLDYHLKQPVKALDVMQAALADDRVRTGHRYALFQRARKLCQTSQRKALKTRWKELSSDPMCEVQEAPKVFIKAVQLAHSIPGGGNLYINPEAELANNEDVTFLKRVEDVALAHYRQNGYPEGIHGEGSTFRCLFSLYMWDLLFMGGKPDTFYSCYQTCPLDLGSDHFYSSRQEAVDKRLELLADSPSEHLDELLRHSWEEHEDTLCAGMNWQRFDGQDHATGLVKCLGGKVLAGIFQRMVTENVRHTSGGMPDLVVWNTEARTCRIVEVKGPGDRLSTKQILWIDYLNKIGASAEVCHVQAVGSKKIQSS